MQWSDRKKWWLDITKSLIVFAIVAVVTAIVIDTYSDIVDARKSKDSLMVGRVSAAAEGLEKATSLYFSAAHDAYSDKCKDEPKRGAKRKYEDEEYDNWKLQLRRTARNADFLKDSIDKAESLSREMHRYYEDCDESMFDVQREKARNASYGIVDKLYMYYEKCWKQNTEKSLVDAVLEKIKLKEDEGIAKECSAS